MPSQEPIHAHPAARSALHHLLAQCRPGWSLPGPFYYDPQIYETDLQKIWRQGWVFAGHSCQIPKPGDFFTLDLDLEPLLIIRNDDGSVHAHHNVCRHRGSLLCTSKSGHAHRLVCPYHQWVYAKDGSLLHCRGMPDDLDKSQFQLHPARVFEVEGLIFVCLASGASDPEIARQTLAPMLRPQGLQRAKIAKSIDYTIHANWKLVWENNRECYHCNVSHPQYIKANFDHYNADDTSEAIQREMTGAIASLEEKLAGGPLAVSHKETGMTQFPDVLRDIWFSINRTALAPGYLSETMDGKTVAPLMGDYLNPDVGTLRMRTLPNFWNHSSCDHSVTTRLLPASPTHTKAQVTWLVAQDAVEGVDYHLDRLLPFWQLTSEQDWTICENQQCGVRSRAYTPGPYSSFKEYNVAGFIQWYLQKINTP